MKYRIVFVAFIFALASCSSDDDGPNEAQIPWNNGSIVESVQETVYGINGSVVEVSNYIFDYQEENEGLAARPGPGRLVIMRNPDDLDDKVFLVFDSSWNPIPMPVDLTKLGTVDYSENNTLSKIDSRVISGIGLIGDLKFDVPLSSDNGPQKYLLTFTFTNDIETTIQHESTIVYRTDEILQFTDISRSDGRSHTEQRTISTVNSQIYSITKIENTRNGAEISRIDYEYDSNDNLTQVNKYTVEDGIDTLDYTFDLTYATSDTPLPNLANWYMDNIIFDDLIDRYFNNFSLSRIVLKPGLYSSDEPRQYRWRSVILA